jgi:multicomponent Na+:H+ antiporter subunit E
VARRLSAVLISVALAGLWLTLSGRTEPLLLALGAVSIGAVVLLLSRMAILDEETAAFHRLLPLARYWVWLGGEIVKANIAVARAVLKIDLDLSPRMIEVKAGQKSDFGRAVFANSITLTPGTVTVDIDGDELVVHALLESMADPSGSAVPTPSTSRSSMRSSISSPRSPS